MVVKMGVEPRNFSPPATSLTQALLQASLNWSNHAELFRGTPPQVVASGNYFAVEINESGLMMQIPSRELVLSEVRD